MKNWLKTKKAAATIAIIALLTGQMASLPVAVAANPDEMPPQATGKVYDLVLLVVDTSLSTAGNFEGLKNKYPGQLQGADDLEARVARYAEDLRDSNELTDVKIIFFDRQRDTVQSLISALDNIYQNGDTSTGHNSRLKGVVMIGDIPLPVVNRQGNRYISMFPYTDFVDRAYAYNEKTESFELNAEVSYPKAEIWHGVIRAPENNQTGRAKLAEFFDKNHLYYAGVPEYSDFGRRLFFGDLLHEEQKMSSDMYGLYLKYLHSLEDIAYFRYNKYWAKELSGSIAAELDGLNLNTENEFNQPTGDSPGFLASLANGSAFESLPDIYSRQIIENILAPYYKLVTKYLAQTNDFSQYTGRYTVEEVDSVAELINVKDEYTKYYIKSVNDALEQKINEVAEKIQEPIGLLSSAEISGSGPEGKFELGVEDTTSDVIPGAPTSIVESILYRFHYFNEVNGKTYVNGVDTEILNSAKQCSVFLGSTRSDYYDENLNFNPKAANGVYSILVRALRSDNVKTAAPYYTAGVNTRLLSTASLGGEASELVEATGGAYAGNMNAKGVMETGAVVENQAKYGISAFLLNPFGNKYANPWDEILDPGDVITAINGKNLSYEYTLDQAIKQAYDTVSKVMDSINDNKLENLKNFPYKIAAYTEPPQDLLDQAAGAAGLGDDYEELKMLNTPEEIMNSERLKNKDVASVVGLMKVDFYHNAQKVSRNISFTVSLKDGVKHPTDEDPTRDGGEGNPEVVVLFNSTLPANFGFDQPSDGAIFTLYQNKNEGFGDGAYDSSAGCNFASTAKNHDRCLAKVAAMPALDAGGGSDLVQSEIPGVGISLKFPENVKKTNDGINSERVEDFQDHVDSFQIPANYKYEDIDEVYYDACFNGLPSVGALEGNGMPDGNDGGDSNLFKFPLDTNTNQQANILVNGLEVADPKKHDIKQDFYGRLLDSFGVFVRDLGDDRDLEPGNSEEEVSDYSAKEELWLGYSDLDAAEIVIHNGDGPDVTLKDFSDRYGLWDGVDNDGDGITDYEWQDKIVDGVYDKKFIDYDEAKAIYGLPSNNLELIARKLLSRNGSYRVPGNALADDRFDQDIVLEVKVNELKKMSSVVVHDEPTMDTIKAQMEAMGAKSLPIDNPRYVAFQVENNSLMDYPEPRPVDGNIDVEAIVAQLDTTKQPGAPVTVKIYYPNLFGKDIENVAQFNSLINSKADELASLSTSYRIFGADADPEDYANADGRRRIKEEILEKYLLPVVNNEFDNPSDGFNLTAANTKKIYDAIEWRNMNIDEKHEYILKYYLNDADGFDAFVSEPDKGYEAAYLVMNGDSKSFDFNFNKDVPEEKDTPFDPIVQMQEAADAQLLAESSSDSGDDDFEFVWLDQFLKESEKFLLAFTTVPNFENFCSSEENVINFVANLIGDEEENNDEDPALSQVQQAQQSGANRIELSTFTYLEINGRSELENLIIDQAEKFKSSVNGESTDLQKIDEESGSLRSDTDTPVDGTQTQGAQPEGMEGGTQGESQAKNGQQLSAEEILGAEKILAGKGPSTSIANTNFDNEIKEILSGDVGHSVSDGGTEDSAVEKLSEGGAENVDDQKESADSSIDSNGTSGTKEDLNGKSDTEALFHWYDYYIDIKYYQKFFAEPVSVIDSGRMLTAINSDRFFAYLPDKQNPFVDADENQESKYLVTNSTNLTADGEALMKVAASIFDKEGHLITDTRVKVKFEVKDVSTGKDPEEIVHFENGDTVNSVEGIATAYLRAGVAAGEFILKAYVVNGAGVADPNYMVVKKRIVLGAGEVAKAEISAESTILLANGLSKTAVVVTLKDANGNIVNDALNNVTIFSNSLGKIDPAIDQNSEAVGVQVSVFDGQAKFNLESQNSAGIIDLVALVTDSDLEDAMTLAGTSYEDLDFDGYIGARKEFRVADSMKLYFKTLASDFSPIEITRADGESITRIGVDLMADGEPAVGFNGRVNFKLITSELGTLNVKPGVSMINGSLNAANVNFKSSKTAGTVQILAEIPGFASEILRFRSGENEPSEIILSASSEQIYTGGQDEVTLTAKVVDKYGNTVVGADGVQIKFTSTEATKGFLKFSAASVATVDGMAQVKVKGNKISGVANIIASHEGLKSGMKSLKVKKHLSYSAIRSLSPKALYISLLGENFGDIKQRENAAQNLLYSGQVEAVSSITASDRGYKKMLMVDPYGKIELLADTLTHKIQAATDSFPYQKVLVADGVENKQLAEIFVVPQPNSELTLLNEDGDFSGAPEGFVVKDLGSGSVGISIEKRGEEIFFVEKSEKGGETVKMVIDSFGRTKILNPDITLRMVEKEDDVVINNFGLVIENKGTALAVFKINEKFGSVTLLGSSDARQNFRAGVYIKMVTDDRRYESAKALTRLSSSEPEGLYIVDKDSEMAQALKPGFGQISLEDAESKFGLGFEGSNKHMLLYSSGNSVGESNKLYASDVGIIFGDPMVKVKRDDAVISDATHFSKDIGRNIFSGQEDILQMVQMDFNGDEREDLLLIYESGLVRLLENEESNSHFRDRGYVLDVAGGLENLVAIDIDADGFDDLIASTTLPCAGKEQCLSVLKNNLGKGFSREKLELAIDGKAYEMKSRDMNKDDCEDLVASDGAGNLRIFENIKVDGECRGLRKNYVYGKNYGFNVDPAADLSSDLFINYQGINLPPDDPNVQSDDGVVLKMTLESSEPEASQAEFAQQATEVQRGVLESEAFASADVPPQSFSKEFGFLPVGLDARFSGSKKTATDLNGGEVMVGDQVRYTITLQNNGGAVNNLKISDVVSGSMELDSSSFACMEESCPELGLIESGMSMRPYVIKNISVPAGERKTIVYTATVKSVPKVHFDLGNDFTDYPDNKNDGYPDILVKPEINPDNALNYVYSVKNADTGKVTYKSWKKLPEEQSPESLLGLDDLMGIMGFDPSSVDSENPDPNDVPDEVKDQANALLGSQSADKDYNGCIDSWQSINTKYQDAAAAVTNAVSGAISALRCSGGGCLPNPYNQAYLVPRWAIPGIAVFAAGVPNIVPIAAFYPSSAPSTFRIYVSPTTTLGVGFAVCAGPSIGHTSPCYTFAVPGGVPGVCQGIKQSIDSAVASVPDSLVNPDLGMTTVVSDGGEATDSKTLKAGNDLIPDAIRDEKGDSPLSASANVNIRIPGFPSVITNWIDNEIDEIYNKLMDPMKFYLILPDFQGFFSMAAEDNKGKERTDFLGLHDFLSTINRLPLIQIEGKEVVMKIPALSKNQIEKYRYQAELWKKHMKKELEKYTTWNCDESPNRKNICDKILLDIQDLVASVQKLMDLLDRIENLPRDILNWRNLEAKYANQIICYLDTVMQFTGGYIHRQQKIVEMWIKAAQDAIRTFKDWKVLLDAVIDYQESCDQCKNDRFSDLGLLLNVFLALPDIPVIPMPKLPDVIFDFSQIRTGVKFTWPDLVFKPEPILLPDLPIINLPDILPEVEIKIPGFDVPDFPELVLPELPDLPPLPLPDLPDIPRPPRIPSIPHVLAELVANLKPIFKILCLLKNGVIPVPEGGLATEVETLTQPSIQVVLPLIKKLAVQLPEIQYDYVKEIRITSKLNFNVNTDFIYKKVDEKAEFWNRAVKGIVEEINKYTRAPYGDALNRAIQEAVDKAKKELKESADQALDGVSALPEEYHLVVKEKYLDPKNPLLNRSITQVEMDISNENLPENSTMNKLAEMRNGLISYTKSLKSESSLIENMSEFATFDKVLVKNDSIRKVAEIGGISDTNVESGKSNVMSFDVLSPQTNAQVQEEVEESKRLIADNFDGGEVVAEDNSGIGKPAKGFYIVGKDGVNENVINYTAELGGNTNVNFMDFDEDDDTDIVYSMGGEVYLKENYENDEAEPKGEIIVGVSNNRVGDYDSLSGDSNGANGYAEAFKVEQICSDKEPPMPSLSKTEYQISVFKPLVVDASNSFDAAGTVNEYYLETLPYDGNGKKVTNVPQIIWSDLNLIVDSDNDGLPWNDKNNPIFKVGPFVNEGDIGVHNFILHVVDEAGNEAKQEMSVAVFAPEITLDDTLARVPVAYGDTKPAVDNMAFSLMRSRYIYRVVEEKLNLVPNFKKVITASADEDGRYFTKTNGAYSIGDFSKEDVIQIQSGSGEVAAEVNGANGNIGNVATGYTLNVVEATDGMPMYIVIKDSSGRELGREYVIADPNVDVSIDVDSGGVRIKDLDDSDSYEFRKLGGDDLGHPGGAVMLDKRDKEQLAIIDSSGNIIKFENKVTLRVKNNSLLKDNLIIEILAGQRVVAEVYIPALSGEARVKIVGPNDVPFMEPNILKASSVEGEGLVNGTNGAIRDLFAKGIIEGQKTDSGFEYRPAQMINRAEFVKVVLKMLCIIPGEEAYKPYISGQGYGDIEFADPLAWYYPYVKEASTLGLVEGYKGDRDEASGLLPFRPDHTVSRAEAVKIILQALELRGVVDLSSITEGLPWYADYMKAGQNITPFLKKGVALRNNYLITPEEALMPEEALNFEQLTEIALRVLEIYNCFEIDANSNGMSDFCEAKYEIADPSKDEDDDGLPNNLECLNNSNPRDEDTDNGGVKDGAEFNLGTDILNAADDKPGIKNKRQKDAVVSGVYLVPAECNTCPCISTFANAADILPGDKFFSAITNKEENYFFSKSEEVTIESTK